MKKLNLEPLPCKLDAQTITETLARLCGRQKKTKQEPCEPQQEDEDSSSKTPGEEVDHEVLLERAQEYLKKKIEEGDNQAPFLLGQLYFEEGWYEDAILQFENNSKNDYQCCYQAAVMYYDGLGIDENPVKGVQYMRRIVNSESPKAKHLRFAAAYNLGRAYFEGHGVIHSDKEAERLWLFAADDGNPKASVKAQCALGMYYSRPATKDLKQAFFWHSEACGNGNLESQAALGVMYLYGQGIRKDIQSAIECLKEAAGRGNVYAQGYLVKFYYSKKMYAKAAELAKLVAEFENVEMLAKMTDCLPVYVAKGVAIANFYLARCLHLGMGVPEDEVAAQKYYSRACELDADEVADLQYEVTYGVI